MADYVYPKVSILDTVYNVTKMFEAQDMGGYSSAQGYTVTSGPNRIHFITSLKTDDNVAVAHVMGEQSSNGAVGGQYSDKNAYGHANDCAYYDSGFFIVQGGGEDTDNDEEDYPKGTQIIRLDNSLGMTPYNYSALSNKSSKVQEYTDKDGNKKKVEALKGISGIAHITGNYFALSQGMRVSICEMHKDTQIFEEISRFRLSKIGNHLTRGDAYKLVPQGIYCTGSKLYKAFSYELREGTEKIKRNDIAVFKFNDAMPIKIEKATFSTSYSCDRTGKNLFEVESLGSPDNGKTMYMLTNIDDNGAQDKLYRVSFS